MSSIVNFTSFVTGDWRFVNMKLNKSLKLLTVITSFSLLATATDVAAWFAPKAIIDNETAPISGVTLGAYFAYGNGHPTTPENPNDRVYGITVPRHLYNLAWLQYLGFFNNDDTQYYFELADNIDMTGWTLPPIGTEENPFTGNFNGNGYVIHGLTVSNNFSDFAKHPGEVQANQFTQPHILGFFGVIGDINDNLSSTSYSSAVNEFSNTGLTGITVKTYLRDSLMGVAAGYVEGNMKNIAVDASTINLDSSISGSTTSYGGFTQNISDFSLVGYTTNKKQIKKVDETIYDVNVSSGYEFNATEQGDTTGWGGSVDMLKMYNRLYSIAGSATRNNDYVYEKNALTQLNGTVTETNKTTARAYTYRDREEGSFVFSAYANNSTANNGNYLYISGGTRVYTSHIGEVSRNDGFTIYNNNRYLGISNGTISNTNTAWHIDSNNRLTATVDGTVYYLTHNVTLSTNTSDTWTKSSNRLTYSGSGWFSLTYYLYCNNNGTWTTTTSRTNITLDTASYTAIEEIEDGTYMDYTGTNVTYFPLVTEDNSNNAARRNTGYVIGGSEDKTTSATYPYKTGDIRVSKYGTSDISNSYSGGNLTNVYTINANLQRETINENNYEKYTSSKEGLLSSITGGNVYGLHFMSANISINNLVTADYALINNQDKTDYQMPSSSIDFNLKEKGIINFFAGTYFSGNNSFFSLHHIERDGNDAITSIKEIAEIYKSTNERKDYIYKYSDGTYSETLTSDYSLKFSTNRIKKQSSLTSNAIYYFEIPVNEGEYALGSVSGGTGAYLMYLDIGANAAKFERTELTEHFLCETLVVSYPDGVALVSLPKTFSKETPVINISTDLDYLDSACVEIHGGYTNSFTIDRNNGDVTLTRSNQSLAPPIYSGEEITLIHDSGSSTNVPIIPILEETREVKRLTYYDVNVNMECLVKTVITDTSIDGGAFTRTITQDIYESTDPNGTIETTYVYNSETDQRDLMKIYRTNTGVRYSSAELINQTTLPISSISSTSLLVVRIVQNGGNGFDEVILPEVAIDTSAASGTYYKFNDYLITITPNGADVVIYVKSYSSGKTIYYGTTQVTGANQTITITV